MVPLHPPGRRRRRAAAAALAAAALFGCHRLAAHAGTTLPNLPLPTAGGNQLWADVAWDDGWRVQQHVWTGHARLLDDGDVRRAWGGVDACRGALRARRVRGEARADTAPVVVLLHGLWRTRDAMAPLAEALRVEGYAVVDVAYPSTRRTIEEHAAQVAELLDGLPGEGREVSFVTHSLGALVTRALLARSADPWRARHRLGRAVFLAPPHRGSALARLGARVPGALALYGAPSREIAEGVAGRLPAPPMPFLDVAAARDTAEGWNPWVPGDDDGVVAVAETHLAGEEAHLVVRGTHTFMMGSEAAIDAAVAFLRGDAARGINRRTAPGGAARAAAAPAR